MNIDKETTATVTTWKMQGRLDVFSIGSLRAAFAAAGEPEILVLDLTEIDTIEPVAIGVLRQGLREQTAKGTRVALCGGSKEIQRLLHLVGIARNFPMLSTTDDAVAADAEVCAIIPPAAIPPRPLDADVPGPLARRSSRSAPRVARPSVRGLARFLSRRRVAAGTATAVITLRDPDDHDPALDPPPPHVESGQPA